MLSTIKNIKIDTETSWKICVMVCMVVLVSVLPELTWAQNNTNTTLDNTICKVVNTLTGRAGKAIATIGVVFLGIGLFLGKMSWNVALATGLGIAAIFGASTIIGWIGGGDADNAAECAP